MRETSRYREKTETDDTIFIELTVPKNYHK